VTPPPGTSPASSARERIVATAAEMFETDGVQRTGINALIARSGVAKDTLYKHFSSKDDLVVEVLRRRDEQWCTWLRAGVERATNDPAERLLAVFDMLDSELSDPNYRGSVFLTASTDFPDAQHRVRHACVEHKTRVRQYLADLGRDAGLPAPEALGFELLLLIDGAICARTMQEDRQAGQRAKQAAAVLIEAARR
jgi:AcrR family transcriptional regulator